MSSEVINPLPVILSVSEESLIQEAKSAIAKMADTCLIEYILRILKKFYLLTKGE